MKQVEGERDRKRERGGSKGEKEREKGKIGERKAETEKQTVLQFSHPVTISATPSHLRVNREREREIKSKTE